MARKKKRTPEAHTIAAKFAGDGGLSAGVERRTLRKSSVQVGREISAKDLSTGDVTVTAAQLQVFRACAVYVERRGKGGRFLTVDDDRARASALKEAPGLFRDLYAHAKKAKGILHPKRWARKRTAELLRDRVDELGGKAPSVETILKNWTY